MSPVEFPKHCTNEQDTDICQTALWTALTQLDCTVDCTVDSTNPVPASECRPLQLTKDSLLLLIFHLVLYMVTLIPFVKNHAESNLMAENTLSTGTG